jgi:hypothetical protein
MYLVELEDGELCVTPWSDGHDWCEADQEYRAGGWKCLTDACATVQRWCHVNDVKAALGVSPRETPAEGAKS